MTRVPLYDDLGADYDRFVDWTARLAFELPVLEGLLARYGARRVLDAACGTGRHAIALAERGYQVLGADLSAGMVAQATANALAAGVEVPFVEAGLGELAVAAPGPFDAVLCLGQDIRLFVLFVSPCPLFLLFLQKHFPRTPLLLRADDPLLLQQVDQPRGPVERDAQPALQKRRRGPVVLAHQGNGFRQ